MGTWCFASIESTLHERVDFALNAGAHVVG